jgi:hypothetical protein
VRRDGEKAPKTKGPEMKGSMKGPGVTGSEVKGSEVKGSEVKRPEAKRPDARKRGDEKNRKTADAKKVTEHQQPEEGKPVQKAGNADEEMPGKHGQTADHDATKGRDGKTAHTGKKAHERGGEKGKAPGLINEAIGGETDDSVEFSPLSADLPSAVPKSSPESARAVQSRARLSAVEAQLAALSTARPGFTLAPDDAKNPQLVGQKQQADESVVNFLHNSSSFVQNLLAPGAQIAATISSGAAAAKAMVNAETRKQQAIAHAEVRHLKKEAESRSWGVIQDINARHKHAVATLQANALAAKAKVVVAHTAAMMLLERNIAVELPKIDQAYAEGAEQYRQAGVKAGDYAVFKANEDARRFARLKEVHQELYDEDQAESALDGPMEAKRWAAREDVARDVGKAYRDGDDGLINEGKKYADELLAGPGKDNDKKTVNQIAGQSREDLSQQYDAAMKAIELFTTDAVANAGKAKDGFIAGARKALKGTLSALDQRLAAQLRMLSSYSQSLADRIDDQAESAVADLTDALAEAGGRLADALTKFQSQIGATPVPDIAALTAQLDHMRDGIVSAAAGVQANFNTHLADAVATLATGGRLSAQELKSLASSGLVEMRKIAAELHPMLARLKSGMTSAFTQLEKNGSKNLDTTVNTMTKGFMEVSVAIDKTFADFNAKLSKGLEGMGKQLKDAFVASVDKDLARVIQEQGDKAAAEVKPRWKSVLKFVLILVVVIVVSIVLAPLAAGIVTAGAGALGATGATLATAEVIGGGILVGAGSSVAGQMTDNVIEGKPIMEGWKHALVIGGVTGALGVFARMGAGKVAGALLQRYGAFAAKYGFRISNAVFDFVGNAGVEYVDARLHHRKMSWMQVGIQSVMSFVIGGAMGRAMKIPKFKAFHDTLSGIGQKGAALAGLVKPKIAAPEITVRETVGSGFVDPVDHVGVSAPEPAQVKTGEAKPVEPQERVAPTEGRALGEKPAAPVEPAESGAPAEPAKPGDIDASEPFKAAHPAQDGHTIKVLEDGRIVKCSGCAELKGLFAPELQDEALKAEFEEIEKMTDDPDAQAEAASKFEKKLMKGIIDEYRERVKGDGISDERIREYVNKGARLNPETGRFIGPGGLELKPDIEAVYDESVFGKKGERFNPEGMDPATKSEFDAVIKERETARAERDKFGDPKSEGFRAAEQRMRDASEKLGNLASDWVMKKEFGAEPLFTGEGNRKFDKVYVGKNGEIYIVEAKGGSGRLGIKQGTGAFKSKIVEQGTKAYRDQTVTEMSQSGVKEQVDAAEKILKAGDKVRYLQIDQPINSAGELEPARLREFKI